MTWRVSPILGCKNPKAMAEWFRDSLGFDAPPEAMFGLPGEGVVYATVARADASVHLQIRRGAVPTDREDIESDIYVYVDDVDALFEEFTAAGVEVFRPLDDEDYGLRDFAILSPEGHRLCFGTPLADL